jgi:hypothetical protein
MPSFLLELYLPRVGSLAAAAEGARRVERFGDQLRYVRTYFVAEDETCFHVFEAGSREAVVEASRRAGLKDARVTGTVEASSPNERNKR